MSMPRVLNVEVIDRQARTNGSATCLQSSAAKTTTKGGSTATPYWYGGAGRRLQSTAAIPILSADCYPL